MSEYDYGNARLRAMKSRLLSSEQLLNLAEVENIELLLSDLSNTPYQRSVDVAIVRAFGFERITRVLQHHLIETAAKMRRFYSGTSAELISLILTRYDIHNLKAILRGLSQHVLPAQIVAALLPIGELEHSNLMQLVATERPRTVIDLLASMRFMIATPLIKLRSQKANATVAEMELCLEQWYFDYAAETLESLNETDSALAQALLVEADLINLLAALRFVHAPHERQYMMEQLQISNLNQLFVRAGKLSYQVLEELAQSDGMQIAVEHLRSTVYSEAVSESLERYLKSKLLSEFERGLQRYRTWTLSRHIIKDPLGIGVPLGYLVLKENEIRNLRAIAWGIALGHNANNIKADLEFVA